MYVLGIIYRHPGSSIEGLNDFTKQLETILKKINNENKMCILTGNLNIECIIFGFPFNSDAIEVLHFCLLYTKYYIYIQRLFHGNKLNLYACLTELKLTLEIEYNIHKSTNNEICFNKYKFIYDNL